MTTTGTFPAGVNVLLDLLGSFAASRLMLALVTPKTGEAQTWRLT
jgi:hypothetical protein